LTSSVYSEVRTARLRFLQQSKRLRFCVCQLLSNLSQSKKSARVIEDSIVQTREEIDLAVALQQIRDDEMLLQCSNCGEQFEEKYISHGAPEIPVTKPEYRFIAIVDSLQKTRIFCVDCVLLYAQMVCTHAKIEH